MLYINPYIGGRDHVGGKTTNLPLVLLLIKEFKHFRALNNYIVARFASNG
jgi:hypothetical protein